MIKVIEQVVGLIMLLSNYFCWGSTRASAVPGIRVAVFTLLAWPGGRLVCSAYPPLV